MNKKNVILGVLCGVTALSLLAVMFASTKKGKAGIKKIQDDFNNNGEYKHKLDEILDVIANKIRKLMKTGENIMDKTESEWKSGVSAGKIPISK